MKNLIIFCIPILFNYLIQQLYSSVDLMFVGNFAGLDASSAIGISSMLITCLIGFFGGFSTGAGILIAKAVGEKNEDTLQILIRQVLIAAILLGIVTELIAYPLIPRFLKWTNTPANVFTPAMQYLNIYALSFVFVLAYGAFSAVLRSVGDSMSTFIGQALGGGINIALDALFICVFHWGTKGAAWASVISQLLAAGYLLTKLLPKVSGHVVFRDCLRERTMYQIFLLGIPVGLQSLVISLSNVFVQGQINMLGSTAIAAFTVYFKVELIIYYPIMALGQGLTTFVGHQIGAKEERNADLITKKAVAFGTAVAAGLSIITMLLARPLFRVFIPNQETIELGAQITRLNFPFYFTYVFLQLFGDSLRGRGIVRQPMAVVLINFSVIRTLALLFAVNDRKSVLWIAACYPFTWVTAAICMTVLYHHYTRRKKDPWLRGKK